MDTLFILIFVLLVAMVLLPVIILIRLGSIERKMNEIERSVLRLRKVNDSKPIHEPIIEEPVIAKPEKPVYTESVTPPIPEPVIKTQAIIGESKTPLPKRTAAFTFENLLSKIGIITLVLGIAFFVKYAIDKDWINEIGRVGIGILTGAVIIAIAHKLRKKYNLFSAILVGGGISILYITITLAFREYHLFNQTVAFIILIAITLFSVVLSLLYNRKELALFSLLGGYASPLMISTGAGNYIVLFTFILILNSGMLLVSMRRKWNILGTVSFICTLLFYVVWLVTKFDNQYVGGLTFAILFFIQFYLLALFDHFLSGKNISPFQAFIILANNLILFAATLFIFTNSGYKVEGLLTISMAVVNAIVMLWLFRRAHVDKKLIYLIIAIVLSFVSLAIPVQLKGHIITMFWAVEMVVLLWLWLKSGIQVFRKGFLIIGLLTLVSYFMDITNYYTYSAGLPLLINNIFITGVVIVASLFACRLLISKMDNPIDRASGGLSVLLNIVVIIIAYLVPFFEIHIQLAGSTFGAIDGFMTMILSAYTALYVAALIVFYPKALSIYPKLLYALITFIVLYLVVAVPSVVQARNAIFETGNHISSFLTHYLALPGLVYIVYSIVKNFRLLPGRVFRISSWILVAVSITILSVELDSTVAQIGATSLNYSELLYDVRTFGYPILWGLIAMALMIWGLRAREVLLRKISLAFFAFIILKFYISDIWLMSQTGRIISFVALGVILLLVSFLIQKIKILITDDHESDNE